MDFTKFSEYGLIGLTIGVLFFILWRILVWVMKWVDKQSEQQKQERECWMSTLGQLNKSIDAHNERAKSFSESVCDAHKFQRDEHKEMIKSLGEINSSLVRINGYTHE